jgi:hypothetical protein
MKPTTLYRITAALLILFGVLHTIGFLRFVPPTPDGQAALAAMNTTHLETAGRTFTYGMFYRGFGLFLTVYLLFGAYVAWHLGNQSRRSLSGIGALPWVFAALQLMTLIDSWLYFPAPPIICSAVIFLCATAAAATFPSASAHEAAIP